MQSKCALKCSLNFQCACGGAITRLLMTDFKDWSIFIS